MVYVRLNHEVRINDASGPSMYRFPNLEFNVQRSAFNIQVVSRRPRPHEREQRRYPEPEPDSDKGRRLRISSFELWQGS